MKFRDIRLPALKIKPPTAALPPKREKWIHIGAPACFKLEIAMKTVNDAFLAESYLVGSVLKRADWRDVDIRMVMTDPQFADEFPNAETHWEFDQKWLLICSMTSDWLSAQSGLPVDFQIHPRKHFIKTKGEPRNPIGMHFVQKVGIDDIPS